MQKSIALAAVAAMASAVYTPYATGQIVSKETFTYGKFRAKIAAPGTKGSTVGFFSQWNGPDINANWNSVEIEIVPSLEPTPVSLDLSYGDGHNR